MRKTIAAILLLVMTPCCGGYDSDCSVQPIQIHGQVQLSCLHVYNSAVLMQKLYEAKSPRDVIPNLDPQASYSFEDEWPKTPLADTVDGGFTAIMAQYDVEVLHGSSVDCGDPINHKYAGGCTKNFTSYLPEYQQLAFVHESLHYYECYVNSICGNTEHVGWHELGYYAMDEAYKWAATDGGAFSIYELDEYNWTLEPR